MIITVKKEVYERLREESELKGVTVPELVRRKLERKLGVEIPHARTPGRAPGRRYTSWKRNNAEYVTINVYLPRDVEEKVREKVKRENRRVSSLLVQ